MARLDALSMELVTMIAEWLPPADAFNFALTCSEKWQQCSKVLQGHKSLYRRYLDIELNPLNEGVEIGDLDAAWQRSAWGVFYAICKDPRIAYHVKCITNGEYYGPLGVFEPSDGQRNACHDAAEGAAALSGIDLVSVAEAIDSEDDSRLSCILMQMCPKFNHLGFADFESGDYEFVGDFLERVAYHPEEVRPGTLGNIRTVSLRHSQFQGSIPIEYVVSLLHLPSVESISGDKVGPSMDAHRLNLLTSARLPVSNMTSLVLNSSSIGLSDFMAILPQIKGLEKFVYTQGGSEVSMDSMPDLCGMVALLARYHGHSLINLKISDLDGVAWWVDEQELMPFPGFRGFQRLRYLRVPRIMFYFRKYPEKLQRMLRELTEGDFNREISIADNSGPDGEGMAKGEEEADEGRGEETHSAEDEHSSYESDEDTDDEEDYTLGLDYNLQYGDELPASLEQFDLWWERYEPFDPTYELLTLLVRRKDREHPRLRCIATSGMHYQPSELSRKTWGRMEERDIAAAKAQYAASQLTFAKACEEHGVQLELATTINL